MKTIILLLIPLVFIYGGSKEAIIECSSDSGRTQLQILDMDLEGNFQSGYLSIDNQKLSYGPTSDADIVSHLEKGVYTIYLYTNKSKYFLEFYALPKSVKKIDYKKGFRYNFNAIIDPSSTDPRNKERINKTITVKCMVTYDWKEL